MLQLCPLSKVDFDDLFESVSEQIVIIDFVGDFELSLIKGDLGLSALRWSLALRFRVSLDGRVEDLVELGLVLRDDISSPLAQVLQIIN